MRLLQPNDPERLPKKFPVKEMAREWLGGLQSLKSLLKNLWDPRSKSRERKSSWQRQSCGGSKAANEIAEANEERSAALG